MRLLLFLLLISSHCSAQSDLESWLPYKTTSGKWSFILNNGEKLNHFQFDSIGMTYPYTEFAIVYSRGKSGVISWHGDTLVPFKYDFVVFKPVRYVVNKKSQYREFWVVGNHTENGTVKGLHNEQGKQVLPLNFERINLTKGPGEQYIISTYQKPTTQKPSTGSYQHYKLDGTFLTDNYSFPNELFEVDGVFFERIHKKDQWGRSIFGLINEFGDTIIPFNRSGIQYKPERSSIRVIGRDYFNATHEAGTGESWMIRTEAIAPNGSVIYSRERSAYKKKGFEGVHFVTAHGKLIGTSASYYSVPVKLAEGSSAILTTDEGSIIVDSTGEVLKRYPNYKLEYHKSYGNTPHVIDFQDSNELWGVMDLRGNILIPPTFTYSLYNTWRYRTKNDTISARVNNRNVSIDLKDWSIIRFPDHQHLSYFKIERRNESPFCYFISSKEDKKALLSKDGKVIIPYEWSHINSRYSRTLKQPIFFGIRKNKLAVYSKDGRILQAFNWKKGTYHQLEDDYYLVRSKRKQQIVNSITGEVIFKTRKVLSRSFAEGLNAELGIATEPQIIQETPLIIRYYHPKKGSIIVDSAGNTLAKTSGTNASNIFPIIHHKKVIGSLFYYLPESNRLAPEVNLNGKQLDSTYGISGVINYPLDSELENSELIEFYTNDDHFAYFTPKGDFVAEYSERRDLSNGNRIFKSELGYNIYSPALVPLLPQYFDTIKPYGQICIGRRDGKECIIRSDKIATSTALYDKLEIKTRLFVAHLGEKATLYNFQGNLLMDNCLSVQYYDELNILEAITQEYIYWLDSKGEIYLKIKR